MKAVKLPISVDALLACLRLPSEGIEIVDAYVEHGTAGVINIVLSGEQFPEVQEGSPYPEAVIEWEPARSTLKVIGGAP